MLSKQLRQMGWIFIALSIVSVGAIPFSKDFMTFVVLSAMFGLMGLVTLVGSLRKNT